VWPPACCRLDEDEVDGEVIAGVVQTCGLDEEDEGARRT
jgi:hypothetical protein